MIWWCADDAEWQSAKLSSWCQSVYFFWFICKKSVWKGTGPELICNNVSFFPPWSGKQMRCENTLKLFSCIFSHLFVLQFPFMRSNANRKHSGLMTWRRRHEVLSCRTCKLELRVNQHETSFSVWEHKVWFLYMLMYFVVITLQYRSFLLQVSIEQQIFPIAIFPKYT